MEDKTCVVVRVNIVGVWPHTMFRLWHCLGGGLKVIMTKKDINSLSA
ncbi:MAG: hypothetical protein LBM76_02190 [Mycoplasmataceae bacterium]|jgi:hypothetical protein|nr:hypothetical protein [Mycoplasmataceae bacterium]